MKVYKSLLPLPYKAFISSIPFPYSASSSPMCRIPPYHHLSKKNQKPVVSLMIFLPFPPYKMPALPAGENCGGGIS
jgi:hypothetical protein